MPKARRCSTWLSFIFQTTARLDVNQWPPLINTNPKMFDQTPLLQVLWFGGSSRSLHRLPEGSDAYCTICGLKTWHLDFLVFKKYKVQPLSTPGSTNTGDIVQTLWTSNPHRNRWWQSLPPCGKMEGDQASLQPKCCVKSPHEGCDSFYMFFFSMFKILFVLFLYMTLHVLFKQTVQTMNVWCYESSRPAWISPASGTWCRSTWARCWRDPANGSKLSFHGQLVY